MTGQTFAEKIFNAPAGSIVFCSPDLVLSHDNTSGIATIFKKMGGKNVADPKKLVVILDHNAPPTNVSLANAYENIRQFVSQQNIDKFHDAGEGICHQVVTKYVRPGMMVVGSDSHTCTAGAFNAFAAGIDRTETAGLWKKNETWFRVPQSIKIVLTGRLKPGVYAKDLSLWMIGILRSDGADYKSIEFHGDGVAGLSVASRMTLANLVSEMGAKNAVFPCDKTLLDYLDSEVAGVWADDNAHYVQTIEIALEDVFPLVAAPHQVDNVKAVSEVIGLPIQQALIGTCTNGRLEDLKVAAEILHGNRVHKNVQMLVIPASRQIYLQAMELGYIKSFLNAGVNVLTPSCGPCLGTGQGIPADGVRVISTANRNFKGRMGNKTVDIFLASPATVAYSALQGKISHPLALKSQNRFLYRHDDSQLIVIDDENRRINGVWNYADVDNLNTDQMFAGNLTYQISGNEPDKIMPHLFAGFDAAFALNVQSDDIIVTGLNFGCGSSREHPAVGLVFAGVQAVVCKSVNRIFYRSALNQGLPVVVLPEAVEAFRPGDEVLINLADGELKVNGKVFLFPPLPLQLRQIFEAHGLVNYLVNQ